MITRRHLLVSFGALTALAFAPRAWAQMQGAKPVPEAATFISDLTDKAISGLTKRDLPPEERAVEFRKIFTTNFDVPAIGRFALGRYWRTASEEEKAEYLKLFEDFIVGTYAARFGDYSGEKIKINGTRLGDEGEVTVYTELQRANNAGPPYKVDWRLRREDHVQDLRHHRRRYFDERHAARRFLGGDPALRRQGLRPDRLAQGKNGGRAEVIRATFATKTPGLVPGVFVLRAIRR